MKDSCKSPLQPDQSSQNSRDKRQLTRLLTLPNFVTMQQKVSEISAVENLCSGKKWTKVHQNPCNTLRTNTPNAAKFDGDPIKNLPDIRHGTFLLPEKYAKVHRIWELSVDWPDPQPFQISSPSYKKSLRYPQSKSWCSRKSGPRFIKMGHDVQCTNASYYAKLHCARSNDV